MEWSQIANVLSWACIAGGAFFALTGTLGIIRFPDVFTRMHGASVVDTMGIGLILVGLMFQSPNAITVIKLGLILVFIFFTSPTTCYALARATLSAGFMPMKPRQIEIISAQHKDVVTERKTAKKKSKTKVEPKDKPKDGGDKSSKT